MITREELKQYRKFEIDFRDTCKHICELLVRYSRKYEIEFEEDTEEFELFDEWARKNKFVQCSNYGKYNTESVRFPLDLLFMSDGEINKWIDNKLEEERLEAERKKQEDELKAVQKAERDAVKKREHDLAEYERIKKEYNL